MASEKFSSKFQLKKFKKHFLIGFGVIFVIMLGLVYLADPKPAKVIDKPTASNVFTAAKPLAATPGDIMAQRLDQSLQNQNQQNQQLQQKLADLESQNAAYKKQQDENESNVATINTKLQQLNTTKVNSSAPTAIATKPQKSVFEDDINSDNSDGDSSFDNSAKKSAANNTTNSDSSSNKANADNNPEKSVSTYIPSNTIVKGVLVSSLSANTGGNATQDPTPMLIRLTDMARLPNEFRSNLKSCMVSASGWGDLSTQRVKARTATLSCVLKSGKAIDIPIDGYIAGEDSKAGIEGMVVSHSGALAAKATLAGFIQGIGQIGQAIGQTQQITPLGGVTTTIDPQQAVISGMGSGVSQAGQTLSQYYLNMLTQISPSIEVAAGRHVTVIFNKGTELKLPINGDADDSDQPLPLN